MSVWIWLVAPLIGLVLGLFGAGGGMLSVPALMYGFGLPIKEAIVISLWFVAIVSLVAALQQRVWQVLHVKLLITFALGGISGSVAGAHMASSMPDGLQQLLFSLLLMFVAVWLYLMRGRAQNQVDSVCHCVLVFFAGIAVGILTGVLGVGAGFLMVPLLVMMGVSHFPTAVAHSLVLISGNAFSAAVSYWGVIPVRLDILLPFVVLASIGTFLGGFLLKRLPQKQLQMVFVFFLLAFSIIMLGDFAASGI